MTSPSYTITIGTGVQERLDEWRKEVFDLAIDTHTGVTTYEELSERRAANANLVAHYLSMLTRLFASGEHDGDKSISLDGAGLYFRYASGFEGGVWRHGHEDPRKVRFDIHT